jgi:hypothetical protein
MHYSNDTLAIIVKKKKISVATSYAALFRYLSEFFSCKNLAIDATTGQQMLNSIFFLSFSPTSK